jgi:hypothetical protein
MNVNFDTKREDDGTFTVVITFTDIEDAEQAQAAGNLVKRALLIEGAYGSTAPFPGKKP